MEVLKVAVDQVITKSTQAKDQFFALNKPNPKADDERSGCGAG